jgi:DHA1 family multidrug resistance protein-like MFS transporter
MVTEPILILLTIYMSFITGLIFLLFEGYPLSFHVERGWSPWKASLAFLPLIGGVILGIVANVAYSLLFYKKQIEKDDEKEIAPEQRLPPMIFAAPILPAGLFWFAFTSPVSTTWAAQIVSGVPIGIAIFVILTQGLKYIVDVYLICANSAISLNTFSRSSVAAAFPLFASAMYQKLGVRWTSIVLACISLGLAPIPLIFYIWGERIRKWSKSGL